MNRTELNFSCNSKNTNNKITRADFWFVELKRTTLSGKSNSIKLPIIKLFYNWMRKGRDPKLGMNRIDAEWMNCRPNG